MTKEQELLIELVLYPAIQAFHDCDDKEKREKYIKDYTKEFCQTHKVDILKAIDKLKIMFEKKEELSQYKYEHYSKGKLEKIILSHKKSSRNNKKRNKTNEDIEFDN